MAQPPPGFSPSNPLRVSGGKVTYSGPRPRWSLILLGLVVLFFLVTGRKCFVLVGAGERAVIFNRFTGTQKTQLAEGMGWIIPWVDIPTLYNVQTQTYTMSDNPAERNSSVGDASDALTALTSDGLPVHLEIAVLYRLDPDRVWEIHSTIGPNTIEDKIVRPQSRATIREVVAQHAVTEVYSGARGQIAQEINDHLRRQFLGSHLILQEVLVKDVRFSQQFQQSIEEKQVAQQEVQRMRYVLDETDKQRKQKVIQAEGEAESIRLKAAALAENPQLVEWEYVKNLPANVKTIVTDGRTILNMDASGSRAGAAAAATE